MLAAVRHISPLTSIQRERVLPIPGHVVARLGQEVSPTDVVAECVLEPKYFILNIAEGLNVTPKKADKLLQRHSGDSIAKGDIIAGPAGLFQRVVRAPFSGLIKQAGNGKVLIESLVTPYELKAGVDGTVKEILPDWGVIIKTQGALIQGVWGNNKITYGIMQLLLESPDDELTAEEIEISIRGTIVVGGHCRDPKVIKNAAEVPVKGLILGSMSTALVPIAQKVSFPIMVIDGFGPIPMNSAAYKLFKTTTKDRSVSLNAQEYQTSKGNRPEVIITLPAPKNIEPLLASDEFFQGQKVYLTNKSYTAQVGTIENILSKDYRFPSGVVAPAAEVILDNDELIKVPLASLESFGMRSG